MIVKKKKICKECQTEQYIWGKGLCKKCYPHKKYVYKKEPTGELELFKQIWSERPHICINCKVNLGETLDVWFFSHIKPKGKYPELRLDKSNLDLLCKICHTYRDHGTKEQFESRTIS